MDFKELVCEGKDFERLLSKLAFQIKNSYADLKNLVFVGIKTRGVPISERIAKEIKKDTKINIPTFEMDISNFRDDKPFEVTIKNKKLFDATAKDIVVVDDVLFTGRTMRAGIAGVLSCGRPNSVKVCVTALRKGYLQMPIYCEFVGVSLDTAQDDLVSVSVTEKDNEDSIKIYSC